MARPMNRKLVLAVLVVSLAHLSVAAGQTVGHGTRSAARELARKGMALMAEGKPGEALDAFNRADEVMHLPSLGLEAARCLVKLDRWVEASERFRAVARMEYEQAGLSESQRNVQKRAQQDAEREGSELGPKIPSLTVMLSGGAAGVTLYLDDRQLPSALAGVEIPVDPGEHVARAEQGEWKDRRTVAVKAAEKARMEFAVPAPPEPAPVVVSPPAETARPVVPPAATAEDRGDSLRPPRPASARGEGWGEGPQEAQPVVLPPASAVKPQGTAEATVSDKTPSSALRTIGRSAVGLGIAGLGMGIATGLVAWSQKSDLESKCPGGQCTPGNWAALDSYNNLKLASTIGFAAGGACLVTGVILVLVAPSGEQPDDPKMAFSIGPRSAQVRIRF